MADAIHKLLIFDVAREKLGRRGIYGEEAEQLLDNRHVVLRNPHRASRRADARRLMVGLTDGGRYLTLVIERTLDPTDWLIVTGWDSVIRERKILWRWL